MENNQFNNNNSNNQFGQNNQPNNDMNNQFGQNNQPNNDMNNQFGQNSQFNNNPNNQFNQNSNNMNNGVANVVYAHSTGLGTTGLVLSIVGFVLMFCCGPILIPSIIGLICSLLQKSANTKYEGATGSKPLNTGTTTAGIVLNILGIVISIIYIIFIIVFWTEIQEFVSNNQ